VRALGTALLWVVIVIFLLITVGCGFCGVAAALNDSLEFAAIGFGLAVLFGWLAAQMIKAAQRDDD
jgi:hypothetical protein